MNKVRLWTLGHIGDSLQNSIFPSREQIGRLRDVLSGIPEEGVVDIIWGPELKLTCSDGTTDEILIPVKQVNGEVLYRLVEKGKNNGS